jgi:hypothetical protein
LQAIGFLEVQEVLLRQRRVDPGANAGKRRDPLALRDVGRHS